MIFYILIIMLYARPPAAEPLLLPVASIAEWNQEIVITPLPNHHFNLKSPNRCAEGKLISVTEESVTCRMSSVGSQELEVFVCDDKNTFCKREMVPVDVRWPNTFLGLWQFLKSFF